MKVLISAIWKYFWFVVRHKWYVYLEARALKVGLWQAFIHDFSKFSLSEFIPYMNKFNLGLDDPEHKRQFDLAWLHHIHNNPHHWQYWILNTDNLGVHALRMPEKYVREMVADWRGVGLTLGKGRENAVTWYTSCKDTLALHPQTRTRVEVLLGIISGESYVQVVDLPLVREAGS